MTCADELRHTFCCPHPQAHDHGLQWETADGCYGVVCMACYYAPCGPAWWRSDLETVVAVAKQRGHGKGPLGTSSDEAGLPYHGMPDIR